MVVAMEMEQWTKRPIWPIFPFPARHSLYPHCKSLFGIGMAREKLEKSTRLLVHRPPHPAPRSPVASLETTTTAATTSAPGPSSYWKRDQRPNAYFRRILTDSSDIGLCWIVWVRIYSHLAHMLVLSSNNTHYTGDRLVCVCIDS